MFDMIVSYIESSYILANARLICRGFANKFTFKQVLQEATFVPIRPSICSLWKLRKDPSYMCQGEHMHPARETRRLIYEGVVPKTLEELDIDILALQQQQGGPEALRAWEEFRHSFDKYRNSIDCDRRLREAVARFPNLDTIEYHCGFKYERAPGECAKLPAADLIRPTPGECGQYNSYTNRVWGDRGSGMYIPAICIGLSSFWFWNTSEP
ncbi:hypothetical protein BU26DRAFT_566171 [Trematosphaeria pertusa]|uniref:Uncharacterized protein n=1 Tax=Trematosphaeria pertusa TaxID=390896 RepID=A0A6A6IB85_9PLEO|nr:uncharacterized protein BU26DRAFT_566171 [Trematosphaeria pertusa]KAF2247182.1 hypothetical protein BU26DRAFT_566171 [Trematosphaeria pertusa]